MSKKKGSNAEREIVQKFWEHDWACIRAAGSGSTTFPSPDLLASNSKRIIALECKATKSNVIYIPKEEILQLDRFALTFGAESWLGIKFNRKGWFFIQPEKLPQTTKNYQIKYNACVKLGIQFKELINLYKQNKLSF